MSCQVHTNDTICRILQSKMQHQNNLMHACEYNATCNEMPQGTQRMHVIILCMHGTASKKWHSRYFLLWLGRWVAEVCCCKCQLPFCKPFRKPFRGPRPYRFRFRTVSVPYRFSVSDNPGVWYAYAYRMLLGGVKWLKLKGEMGRNGNNNILI